MAGNVLEITDDNFEAEVTSSAIPVVVDFWAEWCGPCRMMTPTMTELADEYQGKAKVGKLNIDDNRDTAVRFGINSIPTVLMFKDGQMVKQTVGVTAKKDLQEYLDELL